VQINLSYKSSYFFSIWRFTRRDNFIRLPKAAFRGSRVPQEMYRSAAEDRAPPELGDRRAAFPSRGGSVKIFAKNLLAAKADYFKLNNYGKLSLPLCLCK
jgi:hypothetical protein